MITSPTSAIAWAKTANELGIKVSIDEGDLFYRAYSDALTIPPPAVAKLGSEEKSQIETFFWTIPWTHHTLLMEKVKEQPTRFWYMAEILKNGWSKNVLIARRALDRI